MAPYDKDSLFDRAVNAYFRRQRKMGFWPAQPSRYTSYVDDFETGIPHVVLVNVNGILDVYKLKTNGHIEQVDDRYWPGKLKAAESARLRETVAAPADDGTYLVACLLNIGQCEPATCADGAPVEYPQYTSDVHIAREVYDIDLGGDSDPSIECFSGYVGQDRWSFNEKAADALLTEYGYRRAGDWISGSMDAREVRNVHALTDGYSCEVARVSDTETIKEEALSAK
ncbi:MAG: hypothetical protein ACRDRJ_05085 [Streptosporangiaceae bacterium]